MWLTHDATNDAADRAVVPDVLPLDLLRRGHPDRLHRRCLARRLEIRHLRWRRGAGLAGAGVGKRGGGSTRGLLGFGETAAAGCGRRSLFVLGKGTQRIERPRDGADDISNRFAPPYHVNSEVFQ